MKAGDKALERIGDRLGLDEGKGYAKAVLLVLVFAVILVAGYLVYLWVIGGMGESYSTIYVLSSERTLDLPETVVIGENNTFSVWVTVENHMRDTVRFEILLKITGEMDPVFPISVEPTSVHNVTLSDGERAEELVTVSIENAGRYMVFFELWKHNDAEAKYTDNACVLKIEALS